MNQLDAIDDSDARAESVRRAMRAYRARLIERLGIVAFRQLVREQVNRQRATARLQRVDP